MLLCTGPVPMAQAPPSGTKILVYRGTPLPRLRSVTFQEPLTDCGLASKTEEERASLPRRAAQQHRARARSSRFAAEQGAHACRHMRQLGLTEVADQRTWEPCFNICALPCVAEHCPMTDSRKERKVGGVLLGQTGAPAAHCQGACCHMAVLCLACMG